MKKTFRLFSLALLLVMVLSAGASCGGTAAQPTPQPTAAPSAAPAEPFRMAVILPSAINDLAFSQALYDALVKIQQEMGPSNFEFKYSENMYVIDDAAAAIRDYASQGYDLVFAHGSQYGTSVIEIAKDFPDTAFIVGVTEYAGSPNVSVSDAAADQGGYVMGVMAAMMSNSGILGAIGPIAVGDGKRAIDGFVLGAKATKPDITVLVNYTGSFGDTTLAAQAAQTAVAAGADMLTGIAQQVVGAIGVAEEHKVPWFGNQSSQIGLAPDVVVACQVYDFTPMLRSAIQSVKDGTFGQEFYLLTFDNGGLRMEFNPDYPLPADVRAAADQAIQDIKDGKIDTSVEPQQ